jgi:hypothetical protein
MFRISVQVLRISGFRNCRSFCHFSYDQLRHEEVRSLLYIDHTEHKPTNTTIQRWLNVPEDHLEGTHSFSVSAMSLHPPGLLTAIYFQRLIKSQDSLENDVKQFLRPINFANEINEAIVRDQEI